jgi:hypothetical protein
VAKSQLTRRSLTPEWSHAWVGDSDATAVQAFATIASLIVTIVLAVLTGKCIRIKSILDP